ncbi:MAG TPA: ATP-binding protein [Xanthobacteraceae bacterium]|nr:ATP-binding protein [Xanthobacteraceae bacterium]
MIPTWLSFRGAASSDRCDHSTDSDRRGVPAGTAGRGSLKPFNSQRYCGNVIVARIITCEEGGHGKGGVLEVTLRRFLVGVLLSLVFVAGPAAAQSTSRSILVIDQSDVRGPFYYDVFSALRSVINADSKSPTTIHVESLDFSRFSGPEYEESLQRHFRVKYREKPISVIVAIGDASLDYVLRWRSTLWPGSPVAFAMVDETTVARLNPESDVTGLTMKFNFADAITAARAVVPALKRVVVVGDAWEKQAVFRHWKNQISTFADDIEVSEMTGLTMRDLRRRVATLPDHTAIVYTAMYSDGEGTYYPPADALALIAETANRPVVVPTDTNIGRGSTGGFVLIPSLIGQAAGERALRILNGESAATIPIHLGNFVRPVFDWRQMQRWGVSESSLPVGSEIRFRNMTAWEQYRKQVVVVLVAILGQAALISWLLYERRRRRVAEATTRQTMSELSHVNRVATASELSASIAHELSQPLTGIVSNANAGIRWLTATTPNLGRVEVTLKQIVAAGHHAGEVIASMRALFKRSTEERLPLQITELIDKAILLEQRDIQSHRVSLTLERSEWLPEILGDRVQLLQVILNLIRNAIEAMSPDHARTLHIKSELDESGYVLVSVEDSGTGIDQQNLARIFDPLFTTKPQGLGIGLSICRSIIESHDGRLWATSKTGKGSTLFIKLPRYKAADGWQQVEKRA